MTVRDDKIGSDPARCGDDNTIIPNAKARDEAEKIKKIILKWAKEQEALDKFGEITLCTAEPDDVGDLSKRIARSL